MGKQSKEKALRGSANPKVKEAASAALIGNQFWRLRSKHGRDKLFANPKLLWEAACEYFTWVDDNPFVDKKPMIVSSGTGMGSDIEFAEIETRRPYTINGLCIYFGCNITWFRQFKAATKDEGFSSVLAEIEQICYEQKFAGAAAGHFNAGIISRDLGLVDKQDRTSGGQPIQAPIINVYKDGAPPLNDSESKMGK